MYAMTIKQTYIFQLSYIHIYKLLLVVTIINIRVISIPIFKFFLLKYHRVYFPAKVNIKVQKFHLT